MHLYVYIYMYTHTYFSLWVFMRVQGDVREGSMYERIPEIVPLIIIRVFRVRRCCAHVVDRIVMLLMLQLVSVVMVLFRKMLSIER